MNSATPMPASTWKATSSASGAWSANRSVAAGQASESSRPVRIG
jgi:hypothetical protein